ncbi:MAG: hypothetical protein ACRDNF_10660 [Streptosporangiaceae bacterium]
MTLPAEIGGRQAQIDYDGRRFRPRPAVAQPPGGPAPADGADTAIGHYHQDGDLVWAQFSGSGVRAGWLVGTCRHDGVIDATYCLVTGDGEATAGCCQSTPTLLADGRVRLTERWRRLDGSAGVSQIEEIAG